MYLLTLLLGYSTIAASVITLGFYLGGVALERRDGRRHPGLGWHVVFMSASLILLVAVILSLLRWASPVQRTVLLFALGLQVVSLISVLKYDHRRFASPPRQFPPDK